LKTRIVAALILLVTTGCYSYVPAEFDTVPVGQGVRVFLSREGVTRLRELGGDQIPGASGDQPMVQGTLTRRTASDFSVLIPVASRQVGFLQNELGQQVTLPVADAVAVQLRKVSHVKTGLALASSTAGIAVLIVSIIKGARAPQGGEEPPPGDLRIPLSIQIP
jgi:hypothetical protein